MEFIDERIQNIEETHKKNLYEKSTKTRKYKSHKILLSSPTSKANIKKVLKFND